MKSENAESTKDIFKNFTLTNEEMINVRGGEIVPIIKPTVPPIKI